ncbi:hypothetical protein ACDA63_10955 [Uliginosibacterium sp. sgz301328]|uniref:hypothetical protein n=1 Tax=Uliginosibacterium sp. sgz301328 TaxID=3243764 RepID=UPI00359E90CC
MKLKRLILAAAMCGTAATAMADVGVSVTVGQPGFYGRIDIGDAYPQPVLINPQPVIIQPVPVGVVRQPVYMHVPPGHAKNWKKYCGRYNACGQPVYFVQDNWYQQQYVPRYQERHGPGNGNGHGGNGNNGNGHGNGNNGNGHGKGHGKH